MWGTVPFSSDHPHDLAQLLHEIIVRMEASGCVDEYDVDAPGRGGLDRIERHGCRIALRVSRHARHL